MKSFKDYQPKEQEKPQNFSNSQEWGEQSGVETLIKNVASQYEGKSGMDMMKGILQEAEKAKREGRLSNAELDGFYEQFSPMLGGFEKRKLKQIIDELKQI